MNKTVKKLIVFFTLLCIIILVVFSVQLFLANRDGKDDMPSPEGTPSAPPAETTDGNELTPSASGPANPSDDETPAQSDSAQSERYELPMPGDRVMILYANDDLFEYSTHDMSDVFTYKGGGGEASLELTFVDIPDGTSELASSFLNDYIDYTGGSFEKEGGIKLGNTSLSGTFVKAEKDGETYEAWIVDMEVCGLAVVAHYWNTEQSAAMNEVISTMVLQTL